MVPYHFEMQPLNRMNAEPYLYTAYHQETLPFTDCICIIIYWSKKLSSFVFMVIFLVCKIAEYESLVQVKTQASIGHYPMAACN